MLAGLLILSSVMLRAENLSLKELTTLNSQEAEMVASYVKSCELVKKNKQTLEIAHEECLAKVSASSSSTIVIVAIAAFVGGLALGYNSH